MLRRFLSFWIENLFSVTRSAANPKGVRRDDQRRLLRPNCSALLRVELDRGFLPPLQPQSTAHSQWNQRLTSTGIRIERIIFQVQPQSKRVEPDSS
jgi:hypothetical protein